MATFAIGDVQGCFEPLSRLVAAIGFSPPRDQLVLVGDLVNRGPDSLGVLRWAVGLGDAVRVVLGNHDLHLLGVAAGVRRKKKSDTFDDVLAASDRDVLLDWLARRPLAWRDGEVLFVHAGLLPEWSADDAERLAAEVSRELAGPHRQGFLQQLYDGKPEERWRDELTGAPRWRTIVAGLTRLRALGRSGVMDLEFNGALGDMPERLVPWFDFPGRQSAAVTVAFGHWAALGHHMTDKLIALDSGCVWGNALTAVRLEDRAVFQVPAAP